MRNPSQVSNDDNTFECHVKLSQVRSAQFAVKETPDKTMRIVRLLDADGSSLLSAILHYDDAEDAEDAEGAVQFYERLRERFGDNFSLAPDA